MTELPPLMRDQRKIDADHLRLLGIFHFVAAGMTVLGIAFLCLHYAFMHAMMTDPQMWKHPSNGGPPPAEFLSIFVWFYVVMGTMLVIAGIANLLSGLFMQKRKNRVFSLIVAGFNILQFPFGTILGVFTIMVLLRDSVREAYAN